MMLQAEMGAAEGFETIILAGRADLAERLPGVLARQAEAVHQMRVTLRRLRTAVALFKPHLPSRPAAELVDDLRGLGRRLGEVRDWQVFCAETLPAAFADPQRCAAMVAAAAGPQLLAFERLEAALRGAGLARLEARLAEPALIAGIAAETRLAAIAPALLDRVARAVLRRGRHLTRLDDEGLHDLRKALKTLRYGVDYLGGLYAGKPVQLYLKHCRGLQERLGCINDAAAAVTLGHRLLEPGGFLQELAGWAEARRARGRRGLAGALKGLAQAEPFWTLKARGPAKGV